MKTIKEIQDERKMYFKKLKALEKLPPPKKKITNIRRVQRAVNYAIEIYRLTQIEKQMRHPQFASGGIVQKSGEVIIKNSGEVITPTPQPKLWELLKKNKK